MSSLFKSTIIKGNRLTDFANTTATVGLVIPWGFGAFTSNGNAIWAHLPPTEHVSRKRQGKGGTKVETYTYTLNYAVAFAKGQLYGYKWIKRAGKVVYTNDPNAPVEDQEYAAKWLQKATLYYGTRDQAPDSTIESYEGTGMVSAFKDLGYIVLEEDDVTDNGGAVPNYEACVIASPPEAYLTSLPYAQQIEVEGKVASFLSAIKLDTTLVLSSTESEGEVEASLPSITLLMPLAKSQAEENVAVESSIPSITLIMPLVSSEGDPENADVTATLPSITLDTVLISSTPEPQEVDVAAVLPSITLRT